MKTKMKVILSVLALAVIGASLYFSKTDLQKGVAVIPGSPRPNYIIRSLGVFPVNPTSGQTFTIQALVKNTGGRATVQSWTSLSIISTMGSTDLPPASTGPLGQNATETETWETTSIAGSIDIKVCADSTGVIAESIERNNCKEVTVTVSPPPPPCTDDQYTCASWSECSAIGSQTGSTCTTNSGVSCTLPATATRACTYVPPAAPDLIIDSVTLTQLLSNGIIQDFVTIKNIGTASANFTTANPLRLSRTLYSADSSTVATSETTIYSNGGVGNSTFSFPAGSTLGNISVITYPNQWQGASNMRFIIDSTDVSAESNETNNTYDVAIPAGFLEWVSLPNLRIFSFTLNTTSPTTGNPVNFSASISNSGSTTAAASTATLTINGTATSAYLGEVYQQDVATPEFIGPGTTTLNFEWPSAIAGEYFARVCADSGNVISEFNELDNCSANYGYPVSFTVAPAPSE